MKRVDDDRSMNISRSSVFLSRTTVPESYVLRACVYILTRLFESLSVVMLFSFPDVSILSSVTGEKSSIRKRFIVCLVISSNGITDDLGSLFVGDSFPFRRKMKRFVVSFYYYYYFFLLLFLLSLFFLLLLLLVVS